jgi:hypothetical protein
VAEIPLSRLGAALRRVAADLEAVGARWAVVGGLAVSARTEPRFTRDVDVAVSVASDIEAERVVRDLVARGYRLLTTLEQTAVGRLAAVRLALPIEVEALVVVDLLFASSGIEPEVVAAATPIEVLAGSHLPVASTGHLIALKALSRDDVRRPHDIADLRALLGQATPEEIAIARRSVADIAARGFQRDRDVVAELETLVNEPR